MKARTVKAGAVKAGAVKAGAVKAGAVKAGAIASAGLRPVDRFLVALLGALLPAGFRERQRGEWASDLLTLAAEEPAACRSYLLGAARTLPALWSVARGGPGAPAIAVPAGTRDTVARVLRLGLIWPIVSWVLWVPARYYGFDIPGRLRHREGAIDPQTVWPFDHTPAWLLPLWAVLDIGAWAVVLGGPALVAAVTVTGSLSALVRHRRRPVKLAAVGAAAVAGIVLCLVTAVAAARFSHDWTPATLGLFAIGLSVTTRHPGRKTLIALGIVAIAIQLVGGGAMLDWFVD